MKLLVTGGAGFIGSNFIRHILACRDYEVVNLDKLTYAGDEKNLEDVADDSRYSFVRGDIADKAFLRVLFEKEKFDGVINFAAETHVDRSIEDADPFIQTNVVGTYNLLELSNEFGVKRYHQISTDEVYGDLGDTKDTYFTETTALEPSSPYSSAKASADLLVQSWHHTHGLPTVITRCSNNYGPYQFPEKLIPFFIKRAQNNDSLPVYGDGLNVRDWLHVEDHCEAILVAFEKADDGDLFNIGGHNEKTNLEIAQIILDQVPGTTSKIEFVEDRKGHDRRYAIDPSYTESKLGWKPKHTLEQGLVQTIEWYLRFQ